MKRQDSARVSRRKLKKNPKESPLQTIDSVPEGSSNPTTPTLSTDPAAPARERSIDSLTTWMSKSSSPQIASKPTSPALSSPAFRSHPPREVGLVPPPLFSPPPTSALPPIPKRASYAQAAAYSSSSSSMKNKHTQPGPPSKSEILLLKKPAPAFLAVPGFELTPSPTPTPSPISPTPLVSPRKIGIEKRDALSPIRPLRKEATMRGREIQPLNFMKKVKNLGERDEGRKKGGDASEEGEDLNWEEVKGKRKGEAREEPPTRSLKGMSQSPHMRPTPLPLALGLDTPSTCNIPATISEAPTPIAEHESRPPTPSLTTLEEEINHLLGLSSTSSSNSFYPDSFAPEAPLTIMMAGIPEFPLPSTSTSTTLADESSNDRKDQKRIDEILENAPSGTGISSTSAEDGDKEMEDIPIASTPRILNVRNPDPDSPSSESQRPPPSPPPVSPPVINWFFEPPVPPNQRSVRPKGNPLLVVLDKIGGLTEGGEEMPKQVRENDQARIQEERRKVVAMQENEWGAGGLVVSGSGSAEGEQGGRKGSAGTHTRAATGLGEEKGKAPVDESKWPKVRIPPAKGVRPLHLVTKLHLSSLVRLPFGHKQRITDK